MILPPNREVLEKRILNATGYEEDYLNMNLYGHTGHDDIIGLVLNSSNYVPSLVCKARSRRADDVEMAQELTLVADAFDAIVDDIARFYDTGFNHVCRV